MDSRTERLFTMAQEDTRYRAGDVGAWRYFMAEVAPGRTIGGVQLRKPGEVAVKSLYDQGEAVALRSEDFTCT
jgi:hypothetical protein